MPRVRLHAGAEIDTLSHDEFRKGLDASQQAWFQERARGLKMMRFETDGAVSGGNLSLPAQGTSVGPQSGFIWAVVRITQDGLAGSDVLGVHRQVSDGTRKLGVLTVANPLLRAGTTGMILQPNEVLLFTGTGLTATSVRINGDVIECAAFDLWKLLG